MHRIVVVNSIFGGWIWFSLLPIKTTTVLSHSNDRLMAAALTHWWPHSKAALSLAIPQTILQSTAFSFVIVSFSSSSSSADCLFAWLYSTFRQPRAPKWQQQRRRQWRQQQPVSLAATRTRLTEHFFAPRTASLASVRYI